MDIDGPDTTARATQSRGTDMTTARTPRRIIAALAGPAFAAAALAGGLALGTPHAMAQSMTPATCVSAPVVGPAPTMLNPLTRAAQISTYYAPSVPVPAATACVGN